MNMDEILQAIRDMANAFEENSPVDNTTILAFLQAKNLTLEHIQAFAVVAIAIMLAKQVTES